MTAKDEVLIQLITACYFHGIIGFDECEKLLKKMEDADNERTAE